MINTLKNYDRIFIFKSIGGSQIFVFLLGNQSELQTGYKNPLQISGTLFGVCLNLRAFACLSIHLSYAV